MATRGINGPSGLPLLRSLGLDAILIEFSGGKDSWACLGLALETVPRVVCVHYHLVPGLECEERHLRRAEDMGAKMLRLPLPSSAANMANGVYRPDVNTYTDLGTLTYADVRAVARNRADCKWLASGIRAADSPWRRGMLSEQGGGLNHKSHIAYPVWNWTTAQVRQFLTRKRLPVPPVIGGKDAGGVSLQDASLAWLKQHWPEDFRKVLEVFPFAEAGVMRHAAKARAKEAVHASS